MNKPALSNEELSPSNYTTVEVQDRKYAGIKEWRALTIWPFLQIFQVHHLNESGTFNLAFMISSINFQMTTLGSLIIPQQTSVFSAN